MSKKHNKVNPPNVITRKKSYFGTYPTWSFAWFDFENNNWSFKEATDVDVICTVLERLKALELQPWSKICNTTVENNSLHHEILIKDLSPVAIKRLKELNLTDQLSIFDDSLFSMRVNGSIRLWGVIDWNGLFKIIWFDPNHEVYKSTLRHT
ncbi:MAG: hypothetical protein LBT59_10415 [Clostridiales bacterium]|jgi:hypothetical protein|nr:hypothetical protein [Clostridiales bacterium]